MAAINNHFSFIFLLLTLIFSLQIHARESQFLNKISSNYNAEKKTQVVIPDKEQEPNFLPENENNGYGIYGHESSQLPLSTTTTNDVEKPYKEINPTTTLTNNIHNSKYLPKNYNHVAYVTVLKNDDDNNNNDEEYKNTGSINNKYYTGGSTNNKNYNGEYYIG
uniref:Protein E6-like n=1 Tax=Nicotiana tabacum TaxID=4097 RepID=A0A1S3Y6F0_TOBAC